MMDLRHGADHAPIGVDQEQPSHQFDQRPPRLSRQVRPFRGMARGSVRVAEEFHLTLRAPMVAYGPALCRWCRTRRCFLRHEPLPDSGRERPLMRLKAISSMFWLVPATHSTKAAPAPRARAR